MDELNIEYRQQLMRIIKRMVKDDLIKKRGRGAAVKYQINKTLLSKKFMALDYLNISSCRYDIQRLNNYLPNKTFLLARKIREEMRLLSNATLRSGETLNDRIFKRMIIDFSWMSSKLEGNTYTLGETEELIRKTVHADNRTPYEALMIENHANAAQYIVNYSKDIKITPIEIRGLHALLSNGLLTDPGGRGKIRKQIVEIGQSAYHPASDPMILQTQLDLICDKAVAIKNPFEQSIFLMLYISYLQPFIDVNKRTGRVSANIPLLKNNLCPVSFFGIDEKLYINGIMEFYETGETSTISRAFFGSYKKSVQRFRSALNLVLNYDAAILTNKILKIWILQNIKKDKLINTPSMFIRKQLDKADPPVSADIREEVELKVIYSINNLDEITAIGAGVSIDDFRRYFNGVR